MLCDPDGGHVQLDPHETCKPEQRGMESAVSVDEQQVGPFAQALHGGGDRGELAERKIGRDVGEVGLDLSLAEVDKVEGVRVEADGDRERAVPHVGYIDASEGARRGRLVPFGHLGREPLLLRTQAFEEALRGQRSEEILGAHSPVAQDEPLLRQSLECERQHRAAVHSDHAMAARGLWVFLEPHGHRPGRAQVAEGSCDAPARGRASPRDSSQALLERLAKRLRHGTVKGPPRQNVAVDARRASQRLRLRAHRRTRASTTTRVLIWTPEMKFDHASAVN